MLRLFAEEDRRNLRKSGTEERYEEKETLLQEILSYAKEYGYRIKHQPKRQLGVPLRVSAAEQSAAAAARDAATMQAFTAVENPTEDIYCTEGEPSPASALLDSIYACSPSQESMTDGQPSTTSENTAEEPESLPGGNPVPGTALTSASSEGRNGPVEHTAEHTTTPRSQGKKRTRMEASYSESLEFLQLRARKDRAQKEKEFELEQQRLVLEESRLAFEKEKFRAELKETRLEREQLFAQQAEAC